MLLLAEAHYEGQKNPSLARRVLVEACQEYRGLGWVGLLGRGLEMWERVVGGEGLKMHQEHALVSTTFPNLPTYSSQPICHVTLTSFLALRCSSNRSQFKIIQTLLPMLLLIVVRRLQRTPLPSSKASLKAATLSPSPLLINQGEVVVEGGGWGGVRVVAAPAPPPLLPTAPFTTHSPPCPSPSLCPQSSPPPPSPSPPPPPPLLLTHTFIIKGGSPSLSLPSPSNGLWTPPSSDGSSRSILGYSIIYPAP